MTACRAKLDAARDVAEEKPAAGARFVAPKTAINEQRVIETSRHFEL